MTARPGQPGAPAPPGGTAVPGWPPPPPPDWTAAPPVGRWRRRLARVRRWSHWTLRARLVVVIAVLTAIALIVANAAGLVLLRSYLTDRVDEQLARSIRPYVAGMVPDFGPGAARGGRPAPAGGPGQAVVIYDPGGRVLVAVLSHDELSPPDLTGLTDLAERGEPFTVDSADSHSTWRVLAAPTANGGLAVVASSLRDVDATADGLLLIDGAVMLLVLLVLGLVAALVVRIGLRPLTRMERISSEITAGNLARRVEDADPHTESGRLGIALNVMLDRIGAEMAARTVSEQRLRQFVADASHELRTPLTSIRGFAELYRRGGAPPGPVLDETMGRIENEAARMGLLVEDLLQLARMDLRRPMRRAPVDLLAIAADTIRDAHARRPDRPVRLVPLGGGPAPMPGGGPDPSGGGLEPVTVLGDEHQLRQVAANLVTNALQHTPSTAEITVRVGRWSAPADPALPGAGTEYAVLEVADTGPGVPPEHAGRIFERLYRVDQSRTRTPGVGSGLGLAIVAAIVQAHGGRVDLVGATGAGATFRVVLPTMMDPAPVDPVEPDTTTRDGAPPSEHAGGSQLAPS
ncbi:sensor histidine kinase [Micromonospora sp. NBC_01796]|uniref:sensor histidine kinase n=1 Tax=Micromonospora sp. NBC_01796 TaxID=2975987 RepID=UPI002DDB0F52|nr:HAMP domain-containing sensor histidine kinase [Micromonospora sp. NBC_01796]WSA82962.1 HAMP domain-containing histidine kinase [Micromonospora sp. NBC_01796]